MVVSKLLVEVFMKVMNGLLSRKTRFLCVSLFYYVSNFAGAKISIKSVLLHEIIFLSQCIQQQ